MLEVRFSFTLKYNQKYDKYDLFLLIVYIVVFKIIILNYIFKKA